MTELLPKLTRNQIKKLEADYKGALSKGVPSKLHAPPISGKPQSLKPIEKVLRALDVHGCHCEERGAGEWKAQCPAHDDHKPSLSIKEVPGKVLLRCFAQCSVQAVVKALDLQMSDLFEEPGVVAMYDYTDENGKLLFQIVRHEPKDFRVRRLDGNGGWKHDLKGVSKVLYNLPGLRKVIPGGLVFVCEGEKDADRLIAAGLTATTCPFGAGKWLPEYDEPLRNRRVVILPDNDGPGEKHATQVTSALKGVAREIKVVRLPSLPDKGDVSDWLDNGGTKDELLRLVEQTEMWKEETIEPPQGDLLLFKRFPVEVIPEPVRTYIIDGAKAIGCDPSYIALPLLTALASVIGNARKVKLKNTWSEPPVLWTVIVGPSGTTKSPALEFALRPLLDMENEAVGQYRKQWKDFEAEQEKYKVATKGKSKVQVPPQEPAKPIRERLVTTDPTIEALADRLSESPRGMLVMRDELSGWLNGFNEYKGGRGGDDSKWLELHRAGTLIIDRKGDEGEPIHVHPASVCVTGGIQPGVLQKALRPEYIDNGLAARLLFTMPPTQAKRWTEDDVDADLDGRVRMIFEKLHDLPIEKDDNGFIVPKLIPLVGRAREAWIKFYDEHAQEMRDFQGGELASAWSKLEGYAARFTLVLHLIKAAAGPDLLSAEDVIDEESVLAGITLAKWFGYEAKRIYAMLSEDRDQREDRELLELIQQEGGRIVVRDLNRGPRRFRGPGGSAKATAALQTLVDAGYGDWEHVQPGPEGGQPTTVFVLKLGGDGDNTPLLAA